MSIFEKAAPAVRKETKRVARITLVCTLIMWAVFLVGHLIAPDKIPFNYTVFTGGIGGGVVAVANFYVMGLGVQRAAAAAEEGSARTAIRASYSRRMLMQVLWVILALVVPFIQPVAGIVPLLFPSTGIKVLAVLGLLDVSGSADGEASVEEKAEEETGAADETADEAGEISETDNTADEAESYITNNNQNE